MPLPTSPLGTTGMKITRVGFGAWAQASSSRPHPERSLPDLGMAGHQVLASKADTPAMESLVHDRLGAVINYDAVHGAWLATALSELLNCAAASTRPPSSPMPVNNLALVPSPLRIEVSPR